MTNPKQKIIRIAYRNRNTAESTGALGLNSTFSNDFNSLLFGDAFTYDINDDKDASEQVPADPALQVGKTGEQTAAANEETVIEDGIVLIEDVPFEIEATEQVEETTEEEATAIKGVAFDVDTSSFICSAGNLATHGDEYELDLNQVEQVIEFDYDLTLVAGSDFVSALLDFESSLLSYVGSELESSGCVLGRRQLQRRASQDVVLKKVSSLPEDALNKRAVCNESMVSIDNSECYPVKGYISAYYSGDSSVEDKVVTSIRGLVDKGMSTNALITDTVVSSKFVATRSSTQEVSMLANTQPELESKSIASIIGMFGVGLVAVAVVGLSVFLAKRKYSSNKSKEVTDGGMMPADVENAVQCESIDDDIHDIDTQNSFYGHSISSASTQMVSNRRPKPAANPLYLEEGAVLEETLSEDEAEDALPSFHPDCMCLGN